MNVFLLAAGIILIPAMSTFSQGYDRDPAKEVGPLIRNQFTVDFPDAKNVQFARVKGLNEVSFTEDKEAMNAYYDDGDVLVGTIRKKSFADLPDNAQKNIQNKYPGYTIANIVKFDGSESDATLMSLYGKSMDADNYFVELKKSSDAVVVKVDLSGGVDYFTTMRL
jgi:hypothetical protein